MTRSRCAYIAGFFLLFALVSGAAHADDSQLRIAIQPAITNLPFMIMQHDDLIAKNAKAAGLSKVNVTWLKFSGGDVMNQALLSGNLDLAATGLPSFLILWDKGKGFVDVRGLASYGATPLYLVSRNPDVHTLKDFTTKDRIAVPAVKSSAQAIILQMAAAKIWGYDHYDKLDGLTVSSGHPDAAIAMMSGKSYINAHFSSPPYGQMELAQPGSHIVLRSSDVFGTPVSNGVIYTTTKFHDGHPKLITVFLKSLEQSLDYMRKDPSGAARLYLAMSGDKLSPDEVTKIITEPGAVWTSAPQGSFAYANFMYRIGSVKTQAKSWKDLFFPEAYRLDGS